MTEKSPPTPLCKGGLKSIGLLRLSAMGDVILSVPLIRTLQKQYPNAKITWITSAGAYAILKDLSGVDFVVINKPNNLWDYIALYKRFKPYHFDVLLCMQASFRANILYPLIKADRRIGFDAARGRDGHRLFVRESIPAGRDHLLDGFMRFADQLNCTEKVFTWDLAIAEEDKCWAKKQLLSYQGKKIIAVNPAASKQERCWFVERYVQLLEMAKQRWDVDVILTGGPAQDEKDLAAAIEAALSFPVNNIVGKTTPKQLAAILAEMTVLISPDTGPLHLAVAMGTPVVGLYAVASSQLSGPYLSRELTVDKFPEAVRTFLKKDPNTVSWKTRVHTQEAMGLITCDDVLEKLAGVLSSTVDNPVVEN